MKNMRIVSLVLAVVLIITLAHYLPVEQALEKLDKLVANNEISGAAVFVAIYALATVLSVPGAVLSLGAGAMFGVLQGTLVVSAGSTMGATLAFLIGRYLARERIAGRTACNRKFSIIKKVFSRGDWKIVALLRLSPAVPFNALNYLLGLSPISLRNYLVTSWLFMLPGTLMYVYLGYVGKVGLASGKTFSVGSWLLHAVGVLSTVAVTVYVAYLARKAIEEMDTPVEKKVQVHENGALELC